MKGKEKQMLVQSDAKELAKQIGESQQKLGQLSVDRYAKPAKNTRERKMLRKRIAVLKTVLRNKELAHGI